MSNATTTRQVDTMCPQCGKDCNLSILKTGSRLWVNCACVDCEMAMDENDKWTFYVGGFNKKTTIRTK